MVVALLFCEPANCFSITSFSSFNATGGIVERGHAQHHVGAHALGEVPQRLGGLVGLEMRHHDGHDLRMLVADQVGDRARVHPLQHLHARAVAPEQDAVDDAAGLVLAEGLHQHLAHVVIGTDADRRLLVERDGEFADDGLDLLARDGTDPGHGLADLLHFLRRHVLEHLGGFDLAERKHQDRGLLDAAEFALLVRHRSPSIPSRPGRRGADPL
jgi:hypothetical protein